MCGLAHGSVRASAVRGRALLASPPLRGRAMGVAASDSRARLGYSARLAPSEANGWRLQDPCPRWPPVTGLGDISALSYGSSNTISWLWLKFTRGGEKASRGLPGL